MSPAFSESVIEQAALAWLEIAPGEAMAERDDYGQVCLARRLRRALQRLKTKWAQLEALVGTEKRLKLIAEDLGKALRAAPGSDGRQGDDRLHEPPHLLRALQGHYGDPSGLAP